MWGSNKDDGSTSRDTITSPTANLAEEDVHHDYWLGLAACEKTNFVFGGGGDTGKCP